jgi:hypothetical protein
MGISGAYTSSAVRNSVALIIELLNPGHGQAVIPPRFLTEDFMAAPRDYEDIPGTYVYDAERGRVGYHLNMFCMSLNDPRTARRSRLTKRPTSTASR